MDSVIYNDLFFDYIALIFSTNDNPFIMRNNKILVVGSTYAIPSGVTNDWWAAGLDLNILNAANDSFQAGNFHMWKYVLKDPSAKVEVRATDPYGRVYTCNEIVENGLEYPSYLY